MFNRIVQEPTIFLIRKMWLFSAGQRHIRALSVALLVVSQLLLLAEPAIMGAFLNEIQQHGVVAENLTRLFSILSLFVVIGVVFWIFHGLGRVLERRNAFHIRAQYKAYLLQGVLALDASWHGARDSGDTIDKVNKSTDALFKFSDDFFLIIRIVIQVVGAIIILYFFNSLIALIALAFTIVAFGAMTRFDRHLIAYTRSLDVFENRVSAKVFDALSNITSITILGVKEPIMKGLAQAIEASRALYYHNAAINELKWFVGDNLYSVVKAVSLGIFIVYGYQQGLAVEIGTISALFLYLNRLTDAFFTFTDVYENVILNKVHVQNVEGVEKDFRPEKERAPVPVGWKTFSLRNVNFRYEDTGRETPHVDGVSLTLKRGEKVALIGGSGSGKTTFLKVVHGMYPAATGLIRFDDNEAFETQFTDIDMRTTLVPQEPEVFSSSIRENITLGMDYSEDSIMRAADLAEFTPVIQQLPKGLDSVINEKGVNLSGGQKQRLALARALLFVSGKDLILLDESTSSVDSETETKIYQRLFTHFQGRTILASIHKLNLLKYFDRVVVFEEGRLVDDGTFDELLQRNDAFRRNWERYVAAHQHGTTSA